MKLLFIALFAFSSIYLFADTLSCDMENEPHKIIKCTFKTDRINIDRSYTFEWSNEETPQDHRQRTVILKANHSSIFDYRYYFGRAKGQWNISVNDENETLITSTHYNLK